MLINIVEVLMMNVIMFVIDVIVMVILFFFNMKVICFFIVDLERGGVLVILDSRINILFILMFRR